MDALQLGATLYLPCTRRDLDAVLLGGRITGLRSAVLCLEDAVLEAELPIALSNLSAFLRNAMRSGEGLVYVFRNRGTVWLTPTMRLG
jgi:citrate lyase beta subunit